jgi:pSer/pThr/pTyr-binding forkhead associated (FHA) protein
VWTIEDLGSKNGTQVNQYLITGTQELSHNDVISLGHIKLIVKVKTTGTNGTSNRYSRKINNFPIVNNSISLYVKNKIETFIYMQDQKKGIAEV